ncbi:MAG: hypothetical protein E3K32_02110 [wastewater metagenome]|nr:hypothetical protein [Candidatus Loosdrechtia aerotolerans]
MRGTSFIHTLPHKRQRLIHAFIAPLYFLFMIFAFTIPEVSAGDAPFANTIEAKDVLSRTAILRGMVNQRWSRTTVWFEYGTASGEYTSQTTAEVIGHDGEMRELVSKKINELTPGVTYYYRVVAQNIVGTTHGDEVSFTTVAQPATAGTLSAKDVMVKTAMLRGRVNPRWSPTTAWFEYGTTSGEYTNQTSPENIGSGGSFELVRKKINGLASDTTYFYRIVAQNNGGTVNGDEESFTTIDITPPSIVSTSSSDGASGVDTDIVLTALFSEDVNESTVNTTSFTLIEDGSGEVVTGTVDYDSETLTASFTPSRGLKHSTDYTATVVGVEDLDGNVMTEAFTWGFTTESLVISNETIDAPKFFDALIYSRATALDSSGNAHIVYGGDDLYHAYFDGIEWQYETIDTSSSTANYASIAIDASDNIHISYYDATNRDLMYATNATGSWATESVDETDNVGQYTSIVVDTSDNVYISYYDVTNGDLKYATGTAGSWVTETVDSTGNVGAFTSIAVDTSGNIYISYYDVTNGNLKFATNATGSLVVAPIDTADNVGLYTSIAVDTSGNIYISYYDVTNTALKYATNVSGSLTTETVDNSEDVGQHTSVAIDSSDNLYVSYYDVTNGDLMYATGFSGSWTTEIVESTGNVGQYSSIAIDSSGNIHISYYDATNGDLRYATNASGSWATEIIESTDNVGQYTSIAVDTLGNIHISYYDVTNGDLRYATNASGSWATEIIESTDNVGQYTSIAVDTSGNVHISYYDVTNGGLRYATGFSGSWATEIVDSSDDVGQYTSIAVDTSGNIYISYYDVTNGDLRYATGFSGSWAAETVDSTGNVGQYTSIVLESDEEVIPFIFIVYYDATNGDLRFATNATGSWETDAIDSTGNVGQYASAAISSISGGHVTYYDATNRDLKYSSISDSD